MVALEMKKEVANSDEQTGKMEKKEKQRKATQPEREVISIIEESEGGVNMERKKKNGVEETSIQDRGAKTEKKMTHNDTANDTYNHDVKDIHGFGQETSKKTKKALSGKNGAKVEAEENGGKVARSSVKEDVAEGKKLKMKKSVQSEPPVENIKVEDGEKVGAEEEVQKKVKKKGHDGHNVKEMNAIGQETSKKKKKSSSKYSAKVEAEGNGGEAVCNSVKEEGSEEKEQRKKQKMKNKSVQSEPPVENIKVEDGEKVGAEEEVLKKAKKKKKKKGQIVASVTCAEGTEELMKGMKKGKKRSSALAEQDGGEGVSAKKKKMVKKELVEDDEGFIIPKVEMGAVEGETVKKKRRKAAATMEREEPLEEAETLEVKHQVKKKRKNKKAEAATQEDRIIEEVKSEQIKSKKKGLKEKSEKKKGLKENGEKKKGLKEKSAKTNEPKDESEKKKGSKEKSEKKKGLKEKKRKAPVCEEEQKVIIVEEGEPKEKRKKKREAVLSVVDEEVLDQPTEVSVEGQSGEFLTTVAGGMKGKKKERKNPSWVEIKVEEEPQEGDGKKRKNNKKKIKVEPCDSETQQGQEVASHTDVVFLSKKRGNTDEVTINQQRRLALQMEVDKASQPQTQPTSSGLGQWASAQFDSSDQQQKFLRLMGGFKKGAQPAGSIAGRANMALGKEAQDNLQQALQGEFEQAQSRRMDFDNKGSGLGFTAPSNKKFAIDVNARRSVRFDD